MGVSRWRRCWTEVRECVSALVRRRTPHICHPERAATRSPHERQTPAANEGSSRRGRRTAGHPEPLDTRSRSFAPRRRSRCGRGRSSASLRMTEGLRSRMRAPSMRRARAATWGGPYDGRCGRCVCRRRVEDGRHAGLPPRDRVIGAPTGSAQPHRCPPPPPPCAPAGGGGGRGEGALTHFHPSPAHPAWAPRRRHPETSPR